MNVGALGTQPINTTQNAPQFKKTTDTANSTNSSNEVINEAIASLVSMTAVIIARKGSVPF